MPVHVRPWVKQNCQPHIPQFHFQVCTQEEENTNSHALSLPLPPSTQDAQGNIRSRYNSMSINKEINKVRHSQTAEVPQDGLACIVSDPWEAEARESQDKPTSGAGNAAQ